MAVRLQLRLSQNDFADSLDISLRACQNYERGDRKIPADVLLQLARVHGLDPLWIMEGPESTPRKLNSTKIDTALIAKAHKLVSKAVADSGRQITDTQFAEWVAATYHFFVESGEAQGASSFVNHMIRAIK